MAAGRSYSIRDAKPASARATENRSRVSALDTRDLTRKSKGPAADERDAGVSLLRDAIRIFRQHLRHHRLRIRIAQLRGAETRVDRAAPHLRVLRSVDDVEREGSVLLGRLADGQAHAD